MFPSHRLPSYRRQDDEIRGRHLIAARRIQKHELVFCERPLCSLQSVGNVHQGALVCRACRAFCGGPSLCLKLASGQMNRQDVFDEPSLVPCRQKCGEVYCSVACEQDFWKSHSFLCTGPITDENHPLLQWKRHAIVNNEIFLLVGDVLSAILAHPELKSTYTDFTLVPWWTVATLPLVNEPMGFADAAVLNSSCRTLCEESANLLNKALKLQGVDTDLVTPLFMAQIIGAFEQNSIGIRSRHPLCRDILENDELRSEQLKDVIRCLARAGFIGDGDCEDEDCEDEDCADDGEDDQEKDIEDKASDEGGLDEEEQEDDDEDDQEKDIEETEIEDKASDEGGLDEEEQWDYTAEEIAEFLSGLDIDDREAEDDMDVLFTPLDGTAMFATTCKMNHSCDSNVVVLYRGMKWGEPLVAQCVAKCDIEEGDELCISYVDVNETFEVRQKELANYGFECNCERCGAERNGKVSQAEEAAKKEIDDDDEEDESDDEREIEGKEALFEKLEGVKAAGDLSSWAAVPLPIFAEAQSFVVQQGTTVLTSLVQSIDVANGLVNCIAAEKLRHFGACTSAGLVNCIAAAKLRHFSACTSAGKKLESQLYQLLQENGSWPEVSYREAFWVAAVVASIGLAHDGNFLKAQELLDKAIILGLERQLIKSFFLYVELHADEMQDGALVALSVACQASEATADDDRIKTYGLSKAILCAIPEIAAGISAKTFEQEYVSAGKPAVLRGLAREWQATEKWRYVLISSLLFLELLCLTCCARAFSWFARKHGHRLVPIEIGSMLSKDGMTEKMMSLRSFVSDYLAPSCDHPVWSLEDALARPSAYLAQHALLDQIPELLQYVEAAPDLCGEQGPSHINVGMRSGGTRTPLHYDSHDKLLVQIVGAEYVRMYGKEETPKLYVTKEGTHALQGDMSAVNCELEDFECHPLAREAQYQEVLLLPGDCLFIPSGMWHYVRSLSTSVNVKYCW